MNDPGPQKGPSSVAKIEAERKHTAREIAEILAKRMAAQGGMTMQDVVEEIDKIEAKDE